MAVNAPNWKDVFSNQVLAQLVNGQVEQDRHLKESEADTLGPEIEAINALFDKKKALIMSLPISGSYSNVIESRKKIDEIVHNFGEMIQAITREAYLTDDLWDPTYRNENINEIVDKMFKKIMTEINKVIENGGSVPFSPLINKNIVRNITLKYKELEHTIKTKNYFVAERLSYLGIITLKIYKYNFLNNLLSICFTYALSKTLKLDESIIIREFNDHFIDKLFKNNYLEETESPKPGDLVVYSENFSLIRPHIKHAGIYCGDNLVESKWGSFPVFIHPILHVPSEYDNIVRFFKVMKSPDEVFQWKGE